MRWGKDKNKLLKQQLFVDKDCSPENCDPKYLEELWVKYPIFNLLQLVYTPMLTSICVNQGHPKAATRTVIPVTNSLIMIK
jgi:hypothetical protein